MNGDFARAIQASMADATRTAAVSLAAFSAPSNSPPSPSNSVVCLDVDDDECQLIEPSSSSSSSSPLSSSVPHLPLSPSRWGRLPVDLLALISSFQFSYRHSASGLQHDSDGDGGRSALLAGARAVHAAGGHGRVVPPPMRGVIQVASWPVGQQPKNGEVHVRPDDALLSVRLLLTMSAVCRHWHGAVKPRLHHFQRSFEFGCRVVDCWSGVQQLEMKMSGKHIHLGGVLVKRKRVATVLTSMTRLRSLCLEFNVDLSALDDSDFDVLLPGSTVVNFYPQLQQLTIRLVQIYVPPRTRRRRKARPHHHQSPQQMLYSKVSSWLDCHLKLRSFTLIDTHSTLPMPYAPLAIPQQMIAAMARQPFPQPNMRAAMFPFIPPPFQNQPQPQPLLPPGAMLVAPPRFPVAPQQVYRPPPIPQPTTASLRLLCTGRLQHLAIGGETLVRMAYSEDEEKVERREDEVRQCFQADDVQSIALLGDWQQPRYMDALYDALPSLTHLTLSRCQSPRCADQILAKVGHRITFVLGSISSLAGLSLHDTAASCSALQSLYIHTQYSSGELAQVYASLPSLPSLTQLSVVEQQQPGGRYPVMHHLPELSLPPLPQLLYLHLQLTSYRVFPLVANRNGPPSAILPAKLTHLLLSIPGQQLVPHLSSVPVLCPKLTHCHISSGASVTSQTWETRLGRLKARLRGVWCEEAREVMRHRMDLEWQAEMDVRVGSVEEWEEAAW